MVVSRHVGLPICVCMCEGARVCGHFAQLHLQLVRTCALKSFLAPYPIPSLGHIPVTEPQSPAQSSWEEAALTVALPREEVLPSRGRPRGCLGLAGSSPILVISSLWGLLCFLFGFVF